MEKVFGGNPRAWSAVFFIAAIAAAAYLLVFLPQHTQTGWPLAPITVGNNERNAAYLSGLVTLIAIWALICTLHGHFTFKGIFTGADGRPSTSQFQFFVWTVVVVYVYVSLYTARAYRSHFEVLSNVPGNLLLAMGFALTTVVGAKAITQSKLDNSTLAKTDATEATTKLLDKQASSLSRLVTDDAGNMDLAKVQIIAWTLVAVIVYLFHAFNAVAQALTLLQIGTALNCNPPPDDAVRAICDATGLPDIDTSLLVLMGIGHATYLGAKLVSTTTPGLTGLLPSTGDEKTLITISGVALGDAQNGSVITIDSRPANVTIPSANWTAGQIQFNLPNRHPDGSAWIQHKPPTVQLGVTIGGETSNTLPFTYSPDPKQSLAIPDQDPTTWTRGAPGYTYSLIAIGGRAPYTWSWDVPSAPTGLALADSGLVAGQPTADGTFRVQVGVKDSAGAPATALLIFHILPS